MHRDLKPENVLLTDKTPTADVLIVDFGLGRFVKRLDEMMDTICGTHSYLAPELVHCDRGDLEGYTRAVDSWGVGLTMCNLDARRAAPVRALVPVSARCIPRQALRRYITLFGFNPFVRDTNMATQQAIITGQFGYPHNSNVSAEAKDMLSKLMKLDPRKRVLPEDALQHQWFHMQAWLRPRSPTPMAVAKSHARHTPAECAASLRSHPAWRTWTSRPTCLRRGARSAPGATTTHPPTPRPPRRAPSADPSLLPPTSAATAVNRLKNLVGAGSGRASGVDTDEEMATAAARTTISGE